MPWHSSLQLSYLSSYSRLSLLALSALLLVAGCGDDGNGGDKPRPVKGGQGPQSLIVAASARPATYDPLTTETNDGLEVSRQLFEPLFAEAKTSSGEGVVTGPALSLRRSSDSKAWVVKLRKGVRFQDGAKLDPEAVVKNANRWLSTSSGAEIIGPLSKARPFGRAKVRFVFSQPVDDLKRVLSSPRLAVVSPRALSTGSGRNAELLRIKDAGSGPYRLASKGPEDRAVLERYGGWWARDAGVVPVISKVTFLWQPLESERIKLLKSGGAMLATSISAAGEEIVHSDPNIVTYGNQPGRVYAAARWLRDFKLSPLGAEPVDAAWISSTGSDG